MNKYDKILKKYHDTILEGCGTKKKKITEEDKENDKDYQEFFKKMLKKFGVTEPDKLPDDKKKEFYDAVDKGWKGKNEKPEENESTELDEAAIALDDIIGNTNQLIVQINNLMNKVDKTKKSQLDKAKKSISVLGDILKGIKTVHFKESVGFGGANFSDTRKKSIGGANFTTPDQEMNSVIIELERLINNFKQRGGDFKTYVPELQKAYKMLYKLAMGR